MHNIVRFFPEVPIVGFNRGKSLKYLLIRAKVPVKKETDGKSCDCQDIGSSQLFQIHCILDIGQNDLNLTPHQIYV